MFVNFQSLYILPFPSIFGEDTVPAHGGVGLRKKRQTVEDIYLPFSSVVIEFFLLTFHQLRQVYATGPLRPNFRPVTDLISTSVTAVPPNRHVSKELSN